MSRIKILNAVEQEQVDSPPVFNSVQRKQYFDFSSDLLTLTRDLQTPTNQVCLLVSCGYFKAATARFPHEDSLAFSEVHVNKIGFINRLGPPAWCETLTRCAT
jgi:hypothetical protein